MKLIPSKVSECHLITQCRQDYLTFDALTHCSFNFMAGLYIHIPFCRKACHYCDFHFSTQQEHRYELVSAIGEELKLQKEYLGELELKTIYWGGGTPSLLEAGELQIILDAIHRHYKIAPDPEITLEANPDDLSPDKLKTLRRLGINRLSIGVQSFDDEVLKFVNRAHTSGEAIQCLEDARTAGFDNISIDLMFALPGQSEKTWKENIDQALRLSPEHLSAYSLTIEEKTAFGRWRHAGKLLPVPEEIAADQFELLMDSLGDAGYDQYEISNFGKPGKYSRHNSNYWKQEMYLGVGPSAHSFDLTSRQFNVRNNAHYSKAIQKGRIPFEREVLGLENKINEYIFTTLRTSWGCDLEKLKKDFQFDLRLRNQVYLTDLEQRKLVVIENSVLKLTRAGKLLADGISAHLFMDSKVDS
jgi:oxygen-independent coproporphyrinogen III oxidase